MYANSLSQFPGNVEVVPAAGGWSYDDGILARLLITKLVLSIPPRATFEQGMRDCTLRLLTRRGLKLLTCGEAATYQTKATSKLLG